MSGHIPFQPLAYGAVEEQGHLMARQKAEILRGLEPVAAATVEE